MQCAANRDPRHACCAPPHTLRVPMCHPLLRAVETEAPSGAVLCPAQGPNSCPDVTSAPWEIRAGLRLEGHCRCCTQALGRGPSFGFSCWLLCLLGDVCLGPWDRGAGFPPHSMALASEPHPHTPAAAGHLASLSPAGHPLGQVRRARSMQETGCLALGVVTRQLLRTTSKVLHGDGCL